LRGHFSNLISPRLLKQSRREFCALNSALSRTKRCQSRGFSSFVFGKLGKHGSQLVGVIQVSREETRARTLKNRFLHAKIDFLGECAPFCSRQPAELVIEQREETEETKSRRNN
jgi:hypothetical protein